MGALLLIGALTAPVVSPPPPLYRSIIAMGVGMQSRPPDAHVSCRARTASALVSSWSARLSARDQRIVGS